MSMRSALALSLLVSSVSAVAAEAGKMPDFGAFGDKLPAAGDLFIRARLINLAPRGESGDWKNETNQPLPGTSVAFDNATTLELDMTLKTGPNLGLEFSLALPVEQDITAQGAALSADAPGAVLQTKMLPLTAILQYHLNPEGKIRPYAGLGLSYAYFFSNKSTYALDTAFNGVSNVSLDGAFGFAGQLGVDLEMGDDWFVNLDVKYLDMQTSASFLSGSQGVLQTDIEINPWVLGLGIGRKF